MGAAAGGGAVWDGERRAVVAGAQGNDDGRKRNGGEKTICGRTSLNYTNMSALNI